MPELEQQVTERVARHLYVTVDWLEESDCDAVAAALWPALHPWLSKAWDRGYLAALLSRPDNAPTIENPWTS